MGVFEDKDVQMYSGFTCTCSTEIGQDVKHTPVSYWLEYSSELLAEEKTDLNKKNYKDQMQRHHWATPRPDIGQTGRKKMAKGR